MPPTLITRDKAAIDAFRAEHGEVVMKPLHGHGGAAVFRLLAKDANYGSLFDLFATSFREQWVVQKFLPAVSRGDKRIILVDGAAVRRGQSRAGGKRHPLQHGARRRRRGRPNLSPREKEICATIGPELKKRGLIFVGIDVIDGFLTEINVTSPTGIRAIKRTGGPDVAAAIWDAIESKIRQRWRPRDECASQASPPRTSRAPVRNGPARASNCR